MMSASSRPRTTAALVVFLLLTFALSSIFYVSMIRRFHEGENHAPWFGLMWCPGVSGLVTRLIFQGNLRGHGFGWGQTKYQFAGYWIPLAYATAAYLPLWLAGYFNPDSPAVVDMLRLHPQMPKAAILGLLFALGAITGLIAQCVTALGEELGWRGFLAPELAKSLSFPAVALTSGAIWAVWHYPMIVFADYRGPGPVWWSLVCFTVLVLAISVPITWLRLKSGSVWTAMFFHASHNLFVQWFFDVHTRSGRFPDLWAGEFGAGLALMSVVVAAIFYQKRRELPDGRAPNRASAFNVHAVT